MMRRVAPKRSSITTNHFPSSSIRRYQFHHWLQRGPVDKRAGRSVAHAGSHARFRRHPAKGSRVASPRLPACPRSVEAEVHLSGCTQHSGSVPFGNCAGATWPGGAPLLRTIFYSPKSHQLLLIPLSLYNSHPAWPFRPRRVHQFSRAAARRLGSYISPAPLPAPGFHRSALLYCPVIPWQREPPPSCLHSSCHAYGRSIASDRDCRRHAVASTLASPLSHPLASFCVVSGFGAPCLSRSYSF